MKKPSSKLALRGETIRTLDNLATIVGGAQPTTTITRTSAVDRCPTRPCTTPPPTA